VNADPRVARRSAPRILATATAVPEFSATQAEVKEHLRAVLPLPPSRLDAAMALFDHTAVEHRYSVEPVSTLGRPRTLGESQQSYRAHALRLGRQVAREALARAEVAANEVDLVITVSCTGIMIPSLDAYLVDELGLRRDVRRLPITALGCAGGAAALARAHDFLVGFPAARVLVIAVELPSLSVQRGDASVANLVSTALFGDGAAAAVLRGGGEDDAGRGVRILETQSHVFPRSTQVLGFELRDDGFHSVLSKEIPILLKPEIARLVTEMAARRGLRRADLTCFVLHPGGRKILGVLEEELGLTRDDTQLSWEILGRYGNQSSASVLFVLHEWLTQRSPPPGAHGVLAAFGPGLATDLLLLRWS
jgi:alkylresorcinol/alkylpyrone synthase